jgi:uncharacterized protein YraI
MKLPRLTAALLAVIASALLTTASAVAQEAYTRKPVNMRAGPDRNYPLVAWLPGGATVYVNGCLNDYRWCDVTAGPNRGWIYAGNLEYTYQGRPVTIYGNGQNLALPVIAFILGNYWNDYYRDRPWYGGYNQWNNWRPGTRPPVWRPQPPRPPIVRPQPPRPPIVVQPPRPRPPVVQPPPRPQPQPPRPIPMPKPREQAPVNPPNGSLR